MHEAHADQDAATRALLEVADRVDVFHGRLSIVPTIGRGWWFDIAVDGVPLPFPTPDDAYAFAFFRAQYFTPEDRLRLAGELEVLRDEIKHALPHAEFPVEGARAIEILRSNNTRN